MLVLFDEYAEVISCATLEDATMKSVQVSHVDIVCRKSPANALGNSDGGSNSIQIKCRRPDVSSHGDSETGETSDQCPGGCACFVFLHLPLGSFQKTNGGKVLSVQHDL